MADFLIESLIRNNSKLQTVIWAMELIFLFAGLISTVLMVKDAVFPCSFKVVLSSLKSITISFRSWLSSPLYIGIVINFMVILIAALSTFHQRNMDSHSQAVDEENDGVPETTLPPSSSPPPAPPPPPAAAQENNTTILQDATNTDEATLLIEAEAALEATTTRNTITTSVAFFEGDQSHHIWQDIEEEKSIKTIKESLRALFEASSLTEASEIKKMDSLESSPQLAKMTQSTICTNDIQNPHKEANTEEEKELHLTNEQQDNIGNDDDDSMEAMWKVITEGSEKPVNNHMKKSHTCPVESLVVSVQSIDSKGLLPSAAAAWRELRKSVTFNDAISMRKRAGLMRDTSMSLDNLNRRVETFINKFNNAMRIERQESEQRFLNMVNRGL